MASNLPLQASQAVAHAIHEATDNKLDVLMMALRAAYRDVHETELAREVGFAAIRWGYRAHERAEPPPPVTVPMPDEMELEEPDQWPRGTRTIPEVP